MKKKELKWNNLLDDRCPRCNSPLILGEKYCSCENHRVKFFMKIGKYLETKTNLLLRGAGFKDKFRFSEIRRNKHYGLK